MNKPPLDFAKVESVRKHMLLTKAQMARLIGVSRVAYHGWLLGGPIRPSNDEAVRSALRQCVHAIRTLGWPKPEVRGMTQKARFALLLDQLNQS
jgi:hypothetical protein